MPGIREKICEKRAVPAGSPDHPIKGERKREEPRTREVPYDIPRYTVNSGKKNDPFPPNPVARPGRGLTFQEQPGKRQASPTSPGLSEGQGES